MKLQRLFVFVACLLVPGTLLPSAAFAASDTVVDVHVDGLRRVDQDAALSGSVPVPCLAP